MRIRDDTDSAIGEDDGGYLEVPLNDHDQDSGSASETIEQAIATIDQGEQITEATPQDMLAIDAALMRGSYGALTVSQRLALVKRKCDLLGVYLEHGPFVWGVINKKLSLIPTKNLSQQLRANRQIKVDVLDRTFDAERQIYMVRVRTTGPDGRYDEDIGIVPAPPALKGEALANAMMTAETKAKNRCTLSHCGVGGIDETEVTAMVAGTPNPNVPQLNEGRQVIDPNRGKVRVIQPEPTIPNVSIMEAAMAAAARAAELKEAQLAVDTADAENFLQRAVTPAPAKPAVTAPPRARPASTGAPRAVHAPQLGRPPQHQSTTTPPAPKAPTKSPVRAKRS